MKMSKAEEKAMQYCCQKCPNYKFNCGIKLSSHGRDCVECSSFVKGYKQAEKDNELTWENMFDIFRLVNVVLDDYADGKTRKEVGEEVLKRFKERKKK